MQAFTLNCTVVIIYELDIHHITYFDPPDCPMEKKQQTHYFFTDEEMGSGKVKRTW